MTGIHRRVADEVYARLHEQIVTGARAPGNRLDPTEVAQSLGVSRTPVREAILRLDAEGLVERQPYRGVVVSGVDLDAAGDLAAIRLQLETLAARAGVERLTDDDVARMRIVHERLSEAMTGLDAQESFRALNREFHLILFQAAGTRSLVRIIEDLAGQADRIRLHYDVRRGPAIEDHADILAACEARDVEAAVAATRRHILGPYLLVVPNGTVPVGSLLDLALTDGSGSTGASAPRAPADVEGLGDGNQDGPVEPKPAVRSAGQVGRPTDSGVSHRGASRRS